MLGVLDLLAGVRCAPWLELSDSADPPDPQAETAAIKASADRIDFDVMDPF